MCSGGQGVNRQEYAVCCKALCSETTTFSMWTTLQHVFDVRYSLGAVHSEIVHCNVSNVRRLGWYH